MSEAKHTPLKAIPDGFGAADICDANDAPVACNVDQDRAFLFAAAPDLLDACEALTHWDECWPSAALGEALRKARAALAKAKGGA
jgi:hypothetical protein